MSFADRIASEARADLARRGAEVVFESGQAVLHEGDPADRVLLLVSGHVKVFKLSRAGREIVLDFRGPGELLGELGVISPGGRTASAVAVEAVQALSIRGSEFRSWLRQWPDAMLLLLEIVADRLRAADRQRLEFGAAQTLARVAARLLELAERFGHQTPEGTAIELRIAQDELAAWCGSSREATVKALRSLRGMGLIVTSRRRIVVVEPARLAAHAA